MEPATSCDLFNIIRNVCENVSVNDDSKATCESLSKLVADYQQQFEGFKTQIENCKFLRIRGFNLSIVITEETKTTEKDLLTVPSKNQLSQISRISEVLQEYENVEANSKRNRIRDYCKQRNELKLYTITSAITLNVDAPSHLISGCIL
ncbi:hypothetical protein CHUAL_001507 [Chamberlinius hualienensis]